MSSPRIARAASRRAPVRRGPRLRRRIRRWTERARRTRRRLGTAPAALRGIAAALFLAAIFAAANLVYQVARKPSEMLFPLDGALAKTPAETWRAYGGLFRTYATPAVPPALLAALAQTEAAGDPLARTYWRWRLAWNPFALYRPASSAVGLYQMTDAAFAEARRYCIRDHAVTREGCWFDAFYTRVLPSHAVELASVYLDRNVAAILAGRPAPGAPRVEDLAAVVHLCGAGPARRFVHRGFVPAAGERCGDHDVAAYLARIDALKRTFRRLAAGSRS
jgi:hypothetical protein